MRLFPVKGIWASAGQATCVAVSAQHTEESSIKLKLLQSLGAHEALSRVWVSQSLSGEPGENSLKHQVLTLNVWLPLWLQVTI